MTAMAIENEIAIPEKIKSLKEVMSQSTIYKRHERRLMKNMEKGPDPRPKAVRILAGLPGFRDFIPAYQAPEGDGVDGSENSSPLVDQHFFVVAPSENPHENQNHNYLEPLHVMFTTSVAGAAAEACYGGSAKATSPFQAGISSMESRAVPVVGTQGSVSLFRLPFSTPSTSAAAASAPVGSAQLKAGASTAALLFGIKSLATTQFSAAEIDEETDAVPIFSVASLSASALAGTVVGAIRTVQSSETRFLWTPHYSQQQTKNIMTGLLLQNNMLARHVVGSMLYFASYECFKSFWSTTSSLTSSGVKNHQEATKSPVAVAISGALAGAIYQSTLLYGTVQMRPQQLVMASPQVHRLMAPAVLKAAPAHALLFLGYEMAQGGLSWNR